MKIKISYLIALVLLTLGCWLSAMFLFGALSPGWLLVLGIAAWLFISALVWAARKMSAKVWIFAGLVVLAILFLPVSMLVKIIPARLSQPLDSLVSLMTFLLIISFALIITALLLNSSLNLYKEWQNAGAGENENSQTQRKHAGRTTAIALVLSALLLAKVLHNLYWFTVWDNTDDSLGYIWLIIPILAALFSSEILLITLPGRTKVASILYLVIIPALMILVSARAQRVDFRQLTEKRAGLANQAIETYYLREGRYPQDLQQLTPGYVLSLPEPVIIYGQNWCYDGDDDYYRLGYVYREHWSDPRLTGRIYSTKGEVPDLPRMCEEEVDALQKRYPDYPYVYWDGE
jgi:hypothetical protein